MIILDMNYFIELACIWFKIRDGKAVDSQVVGYCQQWRNDCCIKNCRGDKLGEVWFLWEIVRLFSKVRCFFQNVIDNEVAASKNFVENYILC